MLLSASVNSISSIKNEVKKEPLNQTINKLVSSSLTPLVHTLTGVPVEERLSSEHSGELLADSLEELLDGGGVTDECTRHLESSWRNVTDGGLDVVGDPLNEVRGVLVLGVEHLLIDLLHGHSSSEHGGDGEVSKIINKKKSS